MALLPAKALHPLRKALGYAPLTPVRGRAQIRPEGPGLQALDSLHQLVMDRRLRADTTLYGVGLVKEAGYEASPK